MKFHLTEEQNYIQKATWDFARGAFDAEQILELMEKRCFPEKIFKKACKLDLIGMTYPESAGGQECGMMEHVLVIEALCRKDSSLGIALASADMGTELISRYGNKQAIKNYVTPLLKGNRVASLICPEVGEEQSPVRYRECDDGIVLNGGASLVLNAGIAGYFIIVADADLPDQSPGGKRIMAVVPRDIPGLGVTESCDKLGLDMLSWHGVKLENVKLTGDHLLSSEGELIDLSMELQHNNLLKLSAMFLGIAQGAFDLALGYAKQREQFQRKIVRFQGISQKIASMYVKLQEGRAGVYNAALLHDKKAIDLHDLIAVKLSIEAAAEMITDEALQIHGGVGYMVEFPIEHFFRDVKCLRTFTGRKICHLDLISRKLIGKLK
ncbi:acyl-CoA dehydrogenase family protein [Desulfocicer niacini]